MTESIIQPEPFPKTFCVFGIDRSLLNHVPCVLKTFTRSRALLAYVITCQSALSAYVPHVSTCLVYLCSHVSTCLAISRARTNMPWVPCLTRLVWSCDYLPPCFTSSVSNFDATSVSLPLLLKFYTLLVRLKSLINVFRQKREFILQA